MRHVEREQSVGQGVAVGDRLTGPPSWAQSDRTPPKNELSLIGDDMLTKLKAAIPERYKGPIRGALEPKTDAALEKYRGKKKVVVALAGFYQNLGDMALTYSQKRLIEDVLPDHEVLLFSSNDSYRRMRALKNICTDDDIITTIAGGNMDDISRRSKTAVAISSENFLGTRSFLSPRPLLFRILRKAAQRKHSARTYGRHPRLTIFGQEPETLQRMKAAFPTTPIGYCPDIVLSLQLENPETPRDGVLVCIRNDKEANLSPEQRELIRNQVLNLHENVTFRDTVDIAVEECTPETYESTLEGFWDLLRHQQVVVTDRLHCMIFCAITKTPCVVLANSNHKIEGVYRQWLSNLKYITFVEEFDLASIERSTIAMKNLI
ncbi:MAG: polysaccharide pyruvyl transferase family protein [Nocardioidaceae bacterium]